jgi:hypothetical protein
LDCAKRTEIMESMYQNGAKEVFLFLNAYSTI